MVLVSACLLGVRCRYDGGSNFSPEVAGAMGTCCLIPVCPEVLGGLPIPRPPAEVVGGDGTDVLARRARVVTREGGDVTDAFVRGAEEVLRLAKLAGAEEAWLKGRSPSCGVKCIHDGTFSGGMRPGPGVTAALLGKEGLRLREID
ncbi:MAG: DUF523 domain-containing protein [Bacillota bacterium]